MYNTVGGELSELSGYLGAKPVVGSQLQRRPGDQRVLEGVYGDAAPFIRVYIDLLHDKVADENLHANIWIDASNAPFPDGRRGGEGGVLWDQAEAAVADEPRCWIAWSGPGFRSSTLFWNKCGVWGA